MALSRRATIALATGTAALVTVAGVWLVFGNSPSNTTGQALSEVTSQTTTAVTTTTPTTTAAQTTTVAPITVATTTHPKTNAPAAPVKAMPAPVKPPANVPVPPPPHAAPTPGCTPTKTGTAAAHADVQAALQSAAATQYWIGVANPPLVNQNPPPADGSPDPSPALGPRAVITVPPALMAAIAWQESGWQSNIASCDGGNGTMQIQSATATWINNRFGKTYDYKSLTGNADIGAAYIEWLIAYFGENSFDHHYDITDQDLVVAVLDAYNGGAASVQFAAGHTVVSHYAATVEALMSQQPWNN
jgi:soluble lytic murein transglycosylase-like protein